MPIVWDDEPVKSKSSVVWDDEDQIAPETQPSRLKEAFIDPLARGKQYMKEMAGQSVKNLKQRRNAPVPSNPIEAGIQGLGDVLDVANIAFSPIVGYAKAFGGDPVAEAAKAVGVPEEYAEPIGNVATNALTFISPAKAGESVVGRRMGPGFEASRRLPQEVPTFEPEIVDQPEPMPALPAPETKYGEGFTMRQPSPEVVRRPAFTEGADIQQEVPVEYKPILARGNRPYRSEKSALKAMQDKGLDPAEHDIIPNGNGFGIQPKRRALQPDIFDEIAEQPMIEGRKQAALPAPEERIALPKPDVVYQPDWSSINLPDLSPRLLIENRSKIIEARPDIKPAELNSLIIKKQAQKLETGEMETIDPMRSEADRLGIDYAGIQEGGKEPLHLFTDRENGSTFGVTPGGSVETALAANRERFKPKVAWNIEDSYPVASDMVDGRKVRDHIPNTSSISASFNDGEYTVLPGIREVPTSLFDAPPEVNTRTKKLAQDISESLEISPLIVAIDKEGPYILEGGHRYDALKIMKAKSFPAMVVVEEGVDFKKAPKPPATESPLTDVPVEAIEGRGEAMVKGKEPTVLFDEYGSEVRRNPDGTYSDGELVYDNFKEAIDDGWLKWNPKNINKNSWELSKEEWNSLPSHESVSGVVKNEASLSPGEVDAFRKGRKFVSDLTQKEQVESLGGVSPKNGKVTVYRAGRSEIRPGDFVATKGAEGYLKGAGEGAKVYSREVPLNELWAANPGGKDLLWVPENYHKKSVAKAISEGKIDSHPDYPELTKKAEASSTPEVTGEVTGEVKQKPGYAYIKRGGKEMQRPFTEYKEIVRGKNKGKVVVTVAGKKHIVEKGKVRQWPEKALEKELSKVDNEVLSQERVVKDELRKSDTSITEAQAQERASEVVRAGEEAGVSEGKAEAGTGKPVTYSQFKTSIVEAIDNAPDIAPADASRLKIVTRGGERQRNAVSYVTDTALTGQMKEKYGTVKIQSPNYPNRTYNIINTKYHLENFKKTIDKLEKKREGVTLASGFGALQPAYEKAVAKVADGIFKWKETTKIPFIKHIRKDSSSKVKDSRTLSEMMDDLDVKGDRRKQAIRAALGGKDLPENVKLSDLSKEDQALVKNFINNASRDVYGKALLNDVADYKKVVLSREFINEAPYFEDIPQWAIEPITSWRVPDLVDKSGETYKHTIVPYEDANNSLRTEKDLTNRELRELMPGVAKGSKISAQLQDFAEGKITLDQVSPKWRVNVKKATEYTKDKYNDWLDRVNKARDSVGKKPIARRDDYFTHGQEIGSLSAFFGGADRIPNEIAKTTQFTHPNSPFFKYEKRLGGEYVADGIGNFLSYADNALKVIHYTPALVEAKAYIRHLPPNAHEAMMTWADEVLAGKTSHLDKLWDKSLGRGSRKAWTWARGRMMKNIVLGSARILVQQPSSYAQTFSELATGKARNMKDVAMNISDALVGFEHAFTNSGKHILEQSREYRDRMYIDDIDPTLLNKAEKALSYANAHLDRFMVASAFLGKYRQLTRQGMVHGEAVIEADKFSKRTQASYQQGNLNSILRSETGKNILPLQTFTFNMMNHMAFDVPKMIKERGKAATFAYGLTLLGGMAAVNQIYEALGMTKTWDWMSLVPGLGYLKYGVSGPLGVVKNLAQMVIGDKRDKAEAGANLKKLPWQIIPPFGGEQLRKSIDGYLTLENPSRKKYRIDNDWDRLMSVVFGPGSSRQAREYYEGSGKSSNNRGRRGNSR